MMSNSTMQRELSRFIYDNSYNISTGALNESAQINLSDAVLTKMFELTIGKYNKIDFSEIERSRGDVTKTKFYKNLNECINTLIDMHTVTNKIPSILIVSDALNNLKMMKNTFEYNFRIKNNCAIMIYNTIYYAIMESTSYIIAASVNIVKNSDEYADITIHELDNKNCCLLSALSQFNTVVADNSINKFIKEAATEMEAQSVQNEAGIGSITQDALLKLFSMKGPPTPKAYNTAKIAGAAVGITAGISMILYLGTKIIPLIREIIYWIFRARHKLSEAAALQAHFLELNIESLKHMDPNAIVGRTRILGRRKITAEQLITRQTKHMNRFLALSNALALDSDKANRDAKTDTKQDKVDVSNIVI